jgi:DNA-binding SARP family transcriptional activator/streptogramin lyase
MGSRPLEFLILGPFEVRREGQPVALGARKERMLLAILLLHAGQVVSTDRLIDELWGDDPPATATGGVQVYVSHLRKALGLGVDEVLVTQPPGYLLDLEPGQVDASRFADLTALGRDALAQGDPDGASHVLREALDLWRGDPLSDFTFESFARREIEHLTSQRISAIELRIEADIALGRHAAVVDELPPLISEYPTREPLRAHLMLALYRCGRQAEALEAYREARRVLVAELGIEPNPSLANLHRRILQQDPSLDGTPPRTRGSQPRRRTAGRRVGLAAAALASAAALVIGLAFIRSSATESSGASSPKVVPNALVRIDPRSQLVTSVIRTGPKPDEPTPSPGGLIWTVNWDYGATAVNETTGKRWILHGLSPSGVAFAHPGTLLLTSDKTNTLWGASPTPGGSTRLSGRRLVRFPTEIRDLTFLDGSAWVNSDQTNTMYRVDMTTGRILARIPLGQNPSGYMAYGDGSIWAPNNSGNSVTRIDASTNGTQTITLPPQPRHEPEGYGPAGVTYAFGKVWVSLSGEWLACIDPATNRVVRMIRIGRTPFVYGSGVASGFGAIWVANGGDGTIARITPGGHVSHVLLGLNTVPIGMAADSQGIWVTTWPKV